MPRRIQLAERLLWLLLIFLPACSTAGVQSDFRRPIPPAIAVLPAIDQSGTQIEGISRGVQEDLIRQLRGEKSFRVAAMEEVELAYLKLGLDSKNPLSPVQFQKLGNVLCVDGFVTTNVLRIEQEVSGNSSGVSFSGFGGVGQLGMTRARAVAEIEVAMLAAASGEALHMFTIEEAATSAQLDLAGGYGSNSFNTGAFQNSAVGKALRQARKEIARRTVPLARPLTFKRRILSVQESEVYINISNDDRVSIGTELSVIRDEGGVTDELTGLVLSRDETVAGKVRIEKIADGYSTAAILEGESIEAGDYVKGPANQP